MTTTPNLEPVTFSISDPDDLKKLDAWLEDQHKKIDALVATDPPGHNRFGAIGGAFTYVFTCTTIGVLAIVKCNITKEELSLFGGI